MHPSRLVDRLDRPGDDPLDPVSLLCGGDGVPQVAKLDFLFTQRLPGEERKVHRLSDEVGLSDVRRVEHVAIRVLGDYRYQADDRVVFQGSFACNDRILASGEENAEQHGEIVGPGV